MSDNRKHITLNAQQNAQRIGPGICIVPNCENPCYKGSIKCSRHQSTCPRCLERKITTDLGYCTPCREEIMTSFTYIPSEISPSPK